MKIAGSMQEMHAPGPAEAANKEEYQTAAERFRYQLVLGRLRYRSQEVT